MNVAALNVAALGAGLVGGLLGLFCGAGVLTLCPGSGVGAECARALIGGGCIAFFLSIPGTIGAMLALARPNLAGWLMLIAGIGGVIASFPFYLVPGALLMVGGLLALAAGRSRPESG